MKKMVYVMISLLILLAALFAVGKKSVHHEMYIPSAPSAVWYVLTEIENYPEWNPVTIKVDGILQEGSTLDYTFRESKEKEYIITATVKTMKTNELINQIGGRKGILSFDHQFILMPEDQGTRLIIHEEYRGVAVPFWNPSKVSKAYEQLGHAVQTRVLSIGTRQTSRR